MRCRNAMITPLTGFIQLCCWCLSADKKGSFLMTQNVHNTRKSHSINIHSTKECNLYLLHNMTYVTADIFARVLIIPLVKRKSKQCKCSTYLLIVVSLIVVSSKGVMNDREVYVLYTQWNTSYIQPPLPDKYTGSHLDASGIFTHRHSCGGMWP